MYSNYHTQNKFSENIFQKQNLVSRPSENTRLYESRVCPSNCMFELRLYESRVCPSNCMFELKNGSKTETYFM